MFPIFHGIVTQRRGPTWPSTPWAVWLCDEGAGQTLHDASGNGRDLQLGEQIDPEASSPQWVTDGGVTFLEFAGWQICTPKSTFSLTIPYSIVVIATLNHTFMPIIVGIQTGNPAGLRTDHRGRLALSSSTGFLTDGILLINRWFGACGVVNADTSAVWYYNGIATTGSVNGPLDIISLGGAVVGGRISNAMLGRIAAAAILPDALSVELGDEWMEFLANHKGISL